MEVSVVLCALNEEKRIGRQLRALDAQTGAPDFEVIVVDNGSTDRTADVVRAWIGNEGRLAESAALVDASSTPGIPAARNAGARAATGRVLAFCDADDEVQPGWVAAIARAVEGDVLVGGRVIAVDAHGKPTGDLYGQGLVATRYLPHISGANFGIGRAAYFAVGGFDESLPRYGFDDVDFSWRVQEAGHRVVYASDALVHFTLSGAGASISKRFQLGQGRVLMARRFPRYDSAPYTVRSTIAELLRAGGSLAGTLIRRRTIDRREASRAVAAAGRVVGAMRYRGVDGAPPRRLTHGRRR